MKDQMRARLRMCDSLEVLYGEHGSLAVHLAILLRMTMISAVVVLSAP